MSKCQKCAKETCHCSLKHGIGNGQLSTTSRDSLNLTDFSSFVKLIIWAYCIYESLMPLGASNFRRAIITFPHILVYSTS